MVCPRCGQGLSADSSACGRCGTSLGEPTVLTGVVPFDTTGLPHGGTFGASTGVSGTPISGASPSREATIGVPRGESTYLQVGSMAVAPSAIDGSTYIDGATLTGAPSSLP